METDSVYSGWILKVDTFECKFFNISETWKFFHYFGFVNLTSTCLGIRDNLKFQGKHCSIIAIFQKFEQKNYLENFSCIQYLFESKTVQLKLFKWLPEMFLKKISAWKSSFDPNSRLRWLWFNDFIRKFPYQAITDNLWMPFFILFG